MVDVPVEVKKAFKKGRTKKQYRIEVYTINDDNTLTYEFTIGNDNLVKESVNIDERMCSDRYLKFGLCEGSSMEFQYFGLPSITNKELKVYLDVWYDDGNGGAWYPIMMGYYEVDASSTQFSTGIRKVTAYNKLQAKYLDEKANANILAEFGFEEEANVGDVINVLLSDYSIDKEYQKVEREGDYTWLASYNWSSSTFKYNSLYGDQGPLGPQNLIPRGDTITTNTPIYLGASATIYVYDINALGVGSSIRFTLPDYLDDIDDAIGQFYKDIFSKLNVSVSASTLWDRLRNLTGNSSSYPTKALTNYFFFIKITYTDDTIDYYGKYAKNTKGSFADLAKITFRDVKEVVVCLPNSVAVTNDTTTTYGRSAPIDIFPAAWCYGPNATSYSQPDFPGYMYEWKDDASSPEIRALYITPRKSDGTKIADLYQVIKDIQVLAITGGETEADYIKIKPTELPDVTLRELQSAVYEMNCQYGQINRETDMFSGVELDQSGLYPSETLYPADNLYPNGNTGGKAIHPYPSEYQKLWTDTVGVQSFRYLRITYKAIESGNEVEKVLQRTVNEHGTQNYNMSDNWLFRNLPWTSAQVGEYADAMVAKMQNIRWFPFEMWSVGLPYVETGDAIEIADKEGNTYTTYILQRQLRGIQNLQDTFINGELDVF